MTYLSRRKNPLPQVSHLRKLRKKYDTHNDEFEEEKQITCRVNLLCVAENACSVHYDLENSFRTLNTSKVARLKEGKKIIVETDWLERNQFLNFL